jgi:hypothetical protein
MIKRKKCGEESKNRVHPFLLTIQITNALEKEIDQLFYQLYGLTEEEIRIVEQNF